MNSKKTEPCGPKSQSTMVAGKKRVRNTPLHVWLSLDERAKIQEHMADAGIRNLSAYVRKMALNGYVLHAGAMKSSRATAASGPVSWLGS